jgi:hypothetical protein
MGANLRDLGSPLPAERIDLDENGLPEPGIYGTGNLFAVRTTEYRKPGYENTPGFYETDIVPIVSSIHEEPYVIPEGEGKYGVEVELHTVGPDLQPANLYLGDGTTIVPDIPPELYRSTAEIEAGPGKNIVSLYRNHIPQRVGNVALTLSQPQYNMSIDPVAALMQKQPKLSDLTPSEYIEKNLKRLGPELVDFVGHGIHEHHDMHVGYLPKVSRYLRMITPLLNAGLQSAPFGFGEITPNMYEHFGNEDLRQYDGKQPHSVRYLTRFAASTNGGVGRRVSHDTVGEMLTDMNSAMDEHGLPSPVRVFADHADVRPRIDPPTKNIDHPGRVEICVKDTSALNFETLAAYGELSDTVLKTLEEVVAGGKKNIGKLHETFPTLFGDTYDKAKYKAVQLEWAHQNSIALAYDGNDAKVTNAIGEVVKIQEQMNALLDFAKSGSTKLSSPAEEIIQRSLKPTNEVTEVMKKHDYSLEGYYRTGMGTSAAWMIERAEMLRAQGKTDKEIMDDGTRDRTESFKRYLGVSAQLGNQLS